MNRYISCLLMPLALILTTAVEAEISLYSVQQRWAQINYATPDDAKVLPFEQLIGDISSQLEQRPGDAELLIWRGITRSTLAGVQGGLAALSLVKQARADFELALEVDSNALQGSAYTSLGTLYHKVPGWPIAFGDDERAAELLQMALTLNPAGIDPNYFYAEFLYDKNDYEGALKYLLIARDAKPRSGRKLADEGRQGEISGLLAEIEEKLDNNRHAFALDRR